MQTLIHSKSIYMLDNFGFKKKSVLIYICLQEEKNGKASESKEVKLIGIVPPIEKMDASLSTLTNCE